MQFNREKGSCLLIQRLRHDENATFHFIIIDFPRDCPDYMIQLREMHPNKDLIEEMIIVTYCIDQSDVLVAEGKSPYSNLLKLQNIET